MAKKVVTAANSLTVRGSDGSVIKRLNRTKKIRSIILSMQARSSNHIFKIRRDVLSKHILRLFSIGAKQSTPCAGA